MRSLLKKASLLGQLVQTTDSLFIPMQLHCEPVNTACKQHPHGAIEHSLALRHTLSSSLQLQAEQQTGSTMARSRRGRDGINLSPEKAAASGKASMAGKLASNSPGNKSAAGHLFWLTSTVSSMHCPDTYAQSCRCRADMCQLTLSLAVQHCGAGTLQCGNCDDRLES